MGAYNDDVLFIHIPKTGGTSAKYYMAENLPDVLWPKPPEVFAEDAGRDSPNDEDERLAYEAIAASKLPIGHIPLKDIEEFTGRSPGSFKVIFGIVRNPYAQQVSQWWFWKRRYALGHKHPHDVAAAKYPRIHGWLRDPMCDFHLWYEQRWHAAEQLARSSQTEGYGEMGGFYKYWLTIDGVMPPNLKILKAEDLDDTLPAELAPFMDHEPPPVPHKNAGEGMPWENCFKAGVDTAPDGTIVGQEYVNESLRAVHYKFRWVFDELKLYQPVTLVESQ